MKSRKKICPCLISNVCLSVKKTGDKWFFTKNGDIVAMKYATIKNHSYLIYGTPIACKSDFFKNPYSSNKTDIYLSNGICTEEKFYNISDIKAKLMCLSYKNEYIFIPILHTTFAG